MIKPRIGFHPLFDYGERIRVVGLEMMFFVDCHIEKQMIITMNLR